VKSELNPEHEAMRQEALRDQERENDCWLPDGKACQGCRFDGNCEIQKEHQKAYPCGKKEMDITHCPDCLDHFTECAKKSRHLFHSNVMAYMEINHEIAKHKAEQQKRKQQRAKCRSLAKKILKKKQQIAEMRKELSKIFYYDGLDRAFNHMERTCDPKNEKIREALGD
jgi:hypothetical protein